MSFRLEKRRRLDDQRIDDWLITYADMITLILCFFAIILSVSVFKKYKLAQAKQQVMEQFAAPSIKKEKSSTQDNQLLSIINQYKNYKGITIHRGDRYTSIEMESAPFFDSGSANLRSEGIRLLESMLPIFKSDEFKDYQITVEGHTDDVPINTDRFPSNWELSTDRAAAVVRFLLDHEIPAKKIRAVGYADVFPKLPNRDALGRAITENQAQNRRVVIKLENIEKDE